MMGYRFSFFLAEVVMFNAARLELLFSFLRYELGEEKESNQASMAPEGPIKTNSKPGLLRIGLGYLELTSDRRDGAWRLATQMY